MGRPHLDAHEIGRDPLLQDIESSGVEGVIDLQSDARDPLLAGIRGQAESSSAGPEIVVDCELL